MLITQKYAAQLLSVCITILTLALCATSCTNLDDVNERLDNLESRVSTIEDALTALQRAYNEGKIISSVDPISEKQGGWLITFSDHSTITLVNGSNGKDGQDGKDGENGKDGQDGKDGVDGKDGADGQDGKDGLDGKDGRDGLDGANGITPLIKIDQDGYFCVSYDNGKTYTRLMDNDGNYISAKGEQGDKGEQGEQGEKGEQGDKGDKGDKGERGSDGISVKVVVNQNGYFVIQFYYASLPNRIIDEIVTAYPAQPDNLIHAIAQDDVHHTVTLTMGNGQTYTFATTYTLPTGIAILTTKPLQLAKGSTASFEFRVNPSKALFNYDITSEQCQIALDQIETGTRGSYVTTPVHCQLASISQVYDEQGVMKEGQYRAVIEDMGKSENYDDHLALVLMLENERGEPVEVSSSAFRAIYSSNMIMEFSFLLKDNPGKVAADVVTTPDGNHIVVRSPFVLNPAGLIPTWVTNGRKVLVNGVEQQNGITPQDFTSPVVYQVLADNGEVNSYTVSVVASGLPIISIDTPENTAITSKDEWTTGTTISITMPDGNTAYQGVTRIKGRGNSNWDAPKKPYALKLEQGEKLLGMPKSKRWVLLANWYDRTLLRNDVAFEVARRTHLEWTPRGQFVELVLNGRHMGNYYLCEKIKIDKNRLNLHEMTLEDTTGDAITGGYVMEMDVSMDEQHTFRSSVRELPYMFKEPENDMLNEQKINYMQQFISDLETLLYRGDWLVERYYAEMLDIDTFIDYFIVCELVQNTEPTWPKSTYVYKDMNGKLKAGPVWDCDYATFSNFWVNDAPMKSALYYNQLFNDPIFIARLKELWAEYKPQMETIPTYINAQARQIKSSAELNRQLWPINTRINNDETLSYDDAVARMIENYTKKLQWFDRWIAALN